MTHTRNIRDDVQQAGDPSAAVFCVRDQDSALSASCGEPLAAGGVGRTPRAVSYTHLTLPTIYSV